MDEPMRSTGMTGDAPGANRGEDTSHATARIRREIGDTRAEIAETVEAIEQRLRPGTVAIRAAENLKDDAVERVHALADAASDTMRSAGGAAHRAMGRAGERTGDLVKMMRDNPVPAAMIAMGAAGWLVATSLHRRRQFREADHDLSEWGDASAYGQPGVGTSSPYRGGRAAHAQSAVTDTAFLVGAGALLVGAALGLAVPASPREHALMGSIRESLAGRARQMAADAAGQLQKTASDAVEAASDMISEPSPQSRG